MEYSLSDHCSLNTLQVHLKGVECPVFSGENKTNHKPWKAAFTATTDKAKMPVNEKMLCLQSCLKGKALEMVKDLGYSLNAYESQRKARKEIQRRKTNPD